MATTAAGTPYVEASDLVAGYPAVSLALANHIDTIGKVLQVVRATDSTNRSTTSTSYVDASISVTITPQKSDSAILLIAIGRYQGSGASGASSIAGLRITDSSNNQISGSENATFGSTVANAVFFHNGTIIGYATPATISAVTYKLRFRADGANMTTTVSNADTTGQMFAIEVAA